jgi:hypothetical protein
MQVAYGGLQIRDLSLNSTGRILTIDVDGVVGYRTAIDLSTYLSSTLQTNNVLVGNGNNLAVPFNTSPTGDILADSTTGLTIKTNKIVNNQISSSAAIAYSKLNLAGSIVNNDVASGAAIVYSKLSLGNSILNADISTSANIARTKLASGSAYRIVVNNASGVMTDHTAQTANKAVITDANGLPSTSSTTATQIGYLSNYNQ